MKIKFTLILAMLIGLVSLSANAQVKLPKADLPSQVLKILDNTKGLNLSAEKTDLLKTNNKTFVDQLFQIANGSGSEDEKKSGILNLKNKRSNFLTELLGQVLAKKYLGNVTKGINPLKSKLGLAALAF